MTDGAGKFYRRHSAFVKATKLANTAFEAIRQKPLTVEACEEELRVIDEVLRTIDDGWKRMSATEKAIFALARANWLVAREEVARFQGIAVDRQISNAPPGQA